MEEVDDHMIGRDTSQELSVKPDAFMFIHGDIYDFMSKADDTNNLAVESFAVFYVLEELGFVEQEKITDDKILKSASNEIKRYNRPWSHHSSERYFIGTDGSYFMRILEKTKRGKWKTVPGGVYTLEALRDQWKQLTGHTFDIQKYYSISTAEYKTKYEVRKYREGLKLGRNLYSSLDSSTLNPELKKALDNLRELEKSDGYAPTYGAAEFFFSHRNGDVMNMWDFYGPVLTGERPGLDELLKEIVAYKNFFHNMYAVNKLYMPAFNGAQFGEPEKVRDLALKTAEICFKKMVDREE
jgi:hypothetical protein